MKNNRQFPCRGFVLLLALFITGPLRAEPGNLRVGKIYFEGNRVSEKTLRAELPFKEGGVLDEKALEAAYDALYGMKLFKTVSISTEAAGVGLADVKIVGRDGWFLFPLPFAASGPSGGSAGLMVFHAISSSGLRRLRSLVPPARPAVPPAPLWKGTGGF